MGIPLEILLTGRVYIKYQDDISSAKIGDIMLLLNNDATSFNIGDYENCKISGYVKAQLYDGKFWQNIDIKDFCQNRENQFKKKQKAIDTIYFCKNMIEQYKASKMQRTYRGHFRLIHNEEEL